MISFADYCVAKSERVSFKKFTQKSLLSRSKTYKVRHN